jgi:hypothetical protein
MSDKPNLDNNAMDVVAAAARAGTGLIPFAGSIVAEVVTFVIPNQRVDRLVRFIRALDAKLEGMDKEQVKARFIAPGFVDLLEDTFLQAARATTEERAQYLASLVKRGLTTEEALLVRTKVLLRLLGELNDLEILMLRSHLGPGGIDRDFVRQHQDILFVPLPTVGSREELFVAEAFQKSYRDHLVKLDLLRARYRSVSKDSPPEFDSDTGTLKVNWYDLTRLGQALLEHVGLA